MKTIKFRLYEHSNIYYQFQNLNIKSVRILIEWNIFSYHLIIQKVLKSMVRFFAQISRMVRDVPQFKHIENVFSFPVQKINLFIIFFNVGVIILCMSCNCLYVNKQHFDKCFLHAKYYNKNHLIL